MIRAVKIIGASHRFLQRRGRNRQARRGFAGLLTAFAIIINLLAPLTHSAAMTAVGSELVEICTSGGIDYVRIDHFNADQNLADEECPICGECPVCWMANPAKALANDQVTIRLGHIVSRDHYFAHTYLTTGPRNWTWPETRAPPKLKQI